MNRIPTFHPIRDVVGRLRCRRTASRLVPYSEGKLNRAERPAIQAHLDGCAACSDELAAINGVSAALLGHARDEFNAPADPSAELWSRIHAEICPPTPGAAWDSSTQPIRPRRVFRLDPSWPNSLPVGIAIASALLFGVVLVGGHQSGRDAGGAAETASMNADLFASPVSVSLRSAAPAVAVESAPMIRPPHLRVSAENLLPPKPAEALAEARLIQAGAGRSDPFALVAPEKNPMVAVAQLPAMMRAGSDPGGMANRLRDLVVARSKGGAIAMTDRSKAAMALGVSADRVPVDGVGDSYNATGGLNRDQRGIGGEVSERLGGLAPAEIPALAVAAASANGAPVAEAASSPDVSDASIRGDTPTALPMVDLAAAARRQRGLFSYASR